MIRKVPWATTKPPLVTAELIDAMHEALYAGAEPQMLPRPRRLLCPGPLVWARQAHPDASRDAIVALLDSNPKGVDYVLSQWQGVTEELTAYVRAEAAGDERRMAWWRQRLDEDYGYRIGQLSIIDRESLPWWQARMGDSVGADVDPRDAA